MSRPSSAMFTTDSSTVVLTDPSGAGKSAVTRADFTPTAVLSLDDRRVLVADDPNVQSATDDAFDALLFIAARRLVANRLKVVDADNVRLEARHRLVALVRRHHTLSVVALLKRLFLGPVDAALARDCSSVRSSQ